MIPNKLFNQFSLALALCGLTSGILVQTSNHAQPIPGASLVSNLSDVGNLTNVNGTLFFKANNGTTGVELYKSNGTAAGTFLVKDIVPGANGSYPYDLTNANGTLFFATNYGLLYRSDGTAAGTFQVNDIYRNYNISYIQNLTNVNGTLYFNGADYDGTGAELYKIDGTTGVISLVKDIHPGHGSMFPLSSSPYELTNVNRTLFFVAENRETGIELYRSNGTAASTFLVKDIYPGITNTRAFSSYPYELTNINGTVFFAAYTPARGIELYRSNGTAAGTFLIKDIVPGANGSYPYNLTNVDGTLYFTAYTPDTGRELYKSNGTAGTFLVKNIYPGIVGSVPTNLTNVNGTLYFTANNGTTGVELYRSNGTAAGTFLVKDIYPGIAGSVPTNLTNVNGTLYFTADNPSTGQELYKSNGTAAGTILVKDIFPGAYGSKPVNLTNVNGTLYFTTYNPPTKRRLYRSNGTATSTVPVIP